jgi:hypothetical protein
LKQISPFILGVAPQTALLFVLKQKVSKKFKAYDAFTTIYSACFSAQS